MNVRTDYRKLHRLGSVDRMVSEKDKKNERTSRIEQILEEEQINTRIVQMKLKKRLKRLIKSQVFFCVGKDPSRLDENMLNFL